MEPLNTAMKEEHAVNEMEKALIKEIYEISKGIKDAAGKKELAVMMLKSQRFMLLRLEFLQKLGNLKALSRFMIL